MSAPREPVEIVVDLSALPRGEGVRGAMGETIARIRVIGPDGVKDTSIVVSLGLDRTGTATWIRFTQIKKSADQIRKMVLRFWDRSA